MATVIDFNCDLGESFGSWKLGLDEEVIKYVTSVNVATGFHAGDPDVMASTVKISEELGVGIGAQPGYPDLVGFGRRDIDMTTSEIINTVTYQMGALAAFTSDKKLQHLKPHGAMYNKAVRDPAQAAAIVKAGLDFEPSMIQLVLAGSQWEKVARDAGARVARECFADRAVTPDGALAPRSQPNAVLHDINEVIDRSLRLAIEGRVTAVDGTNIDFVADSICLHGDNPGAVELAAALRQAFDKEGLQIRPMREFIP